jgi:diketogulonate reductase-like aldo/keto reductase
MCGPSSVKAVHRLEINTVAYTPLKGKSYIPLPAELAAKKAIANLKNKDNECFKWCVTRALNPIEDHPERITKELKEQAEQLNWTVIEFLVAVDENTGLKEITMLGSIFLGMKKKTASTL